MELKFRSVKKVSERLEQYKKELISKIETEIKELKNLTKEERDKLEKYLLTYVNNKFEDYDKNIVEPVIKTVEIMNGDKDTIGSFRNAISEATQIDADKLERLNKLLNSFKDCESYFAKTLKEQNSKVREEFENTLKIELEKAKKENEALKESFENKLKEQTELFKKTVEEIKSSIPKQSIDLLKIKKDNKVEFRFKPSTDTMRIWCEILENEKDNEFTMVSENTLIPVDKDGKVFKIDSEENLEGKIARVNYFYLPSMQKQ